MHDVSTFRLYLLRATYLLITAGLAMMIWPGLLAPPPGLEHMRGVTWSLLGGVSLLALVGIRHPLRMLPILFFELVWKVLWLLLIALPARSAGTLTPEMRESVFETGIGAIVVALVMPWGYVMATWVRGPGDRWGRGAAPAPPASAVPTAPA